MESVYELMRQFSIPKCSPFRGTKKLAHCKKKTLKRSLLCGHHQFGSRFLLVSPLFLKLANSIFRTSKISTKIVSGISVLFKSHHLALEVTLLISAHRLT